MKHPNLFLGAALIALASPALADHGGPAGAAGGGIAVFSPDTLKARQGGFDLRFFFTRPDQRSDAVLEALAGEHVHAHNTDFNFNASIGLAYGLTDRLTVSVALPYVVRDNLREGAHAHSGGASLNSVKQLGTVSGIGDATLLAKYRLTGEEGARFALVGGLKMPTGETDAYAPDGERLETEHQPGTGSWDPIFGASAAAKLGEVELTASAIYQFSTQGAQGTRLGDRLQGGVSLSHRFGGAEKPHHHDHGSAEAHHHHDEAERKQDSWDAFVEIGGEWEGRQTVAGEIEDASGGAWIYVAPGVRFNSASGWSAGAAFALPVWQDIRPSHPDNAYRLMVSVGRAF